MKTFFKGLFTPFLGLTSLYLVNIQRNSKFHPPHQNFLDPLLSAGSRFFLELSAPPLKYAGCTPGVTGIQTYLARLERTQHLLDLI